MILISFLIPVFNNFHGVERILKFISKNNREEFEFIIINDFSNIEIDKLIKSSECILFDNLIYYNNNVNMGAVPTWNKLTSIARGEYIQFIHHDECPDPDLYGIKILQFLNSDIDIIILKTRIFNKFKFSYFHSFQFTKRLLLSKYPKYLFWRNIIGSPSNIIVKRSIINSFNNSLKWFVDVEWIYNCIIKSKGQILYSDNLICNSFYYSNSITESIKYRLTDIKAHERAIIKLKYFKKRAKFKYIFFTPLYFFLKLFDMIIWYLLRIILIFSGLICYLKKL